MPTALRDERELLRESDRAPGARKRGCGLHQRAHEPLHHQQLSGAWQRKSNANGKLQAPAARRWQVRSRDIRSNNTGRQRQMPPSAPTCTWASAVLGVLGEKMSRARRGTLRANCERVRAEGDARNNTWNELQRSPSLRLPRRAPRPGRFRAVAAAAPPPFYFYTQTYIPQSERKHLLSTSTLIF